MLIGYIPDKADFDQMIKKIRSEAADQVKQLEAASSKVWQQVEKAKKEGKGQADSFLKGLKQGKWACSFDRLSPVPPPPIRSTYLDNVSGCRLCSA